MKVANNLNTVDQTEDLRAFERRIMEYISYLHPSTSRWRIVLVVISLCTTAGAWLWLMDPNTAREPFLISLWQHPFFTLSSCALIILFCIGIHKRVVAPSINSEIVGRDNIGVALDNGYKYSMKESHFSGSEL